MIRGVLSEDLTDRSPTRIHKAYFAEKSLETHPTHSLHRWAHTNAALTTAILSVSIYPEAIGTDGQCREVFEN